MKNTKKIKFLSALSISLLFIFSFSTSAHGAQKRKRINAEKLQKKYWTTKGYKTGVVQGRKFFKEKKIRLSLDYMNLMNDKYSSTDGLSNLRGEMSYFLTERFAVGAFYENLELKNNTAIAEMQKFNAGGVILDHVKATNFFGASIEFVPLYSKMSWMNRKIIYFDLSVSPKLGLATYAQQLEDGSNPEKTSVLAGLDIAANVFINKKVSFSLGYRTRAFQAEVIKYNNSSLVVEDSKMNFYNFVTLGFNYFL